MTAVKMEYWSAVHLAPMWAANLAGKTVAQMVESWAEMSALSMAVPKADQ